MGLQKKPQTQEISFFIDAFFILKNKSTPKPRLDSCFLNPKKKKKINHITFITVQLAYSHSYFLYYLTGNLKSFSKTKST